MGRSVLFCEHRDLCCCARLGDLYCGASQGYDLMVCSCTLRRNLSIVFLEKYKIQILEIFFSAWEKTILKFRRGMWYSVGDEHLRVCLHAIKNNKLPMSLATNRDSIAEVPDGCKMGETIGNTLSRFAA